jgi:hypothetical protein
MPMVFTPVVIGGDEAWGKLVMSWTTQKDFVNGNGTAAYPQPAGTATNVPATLLTLDQFEQAVSGSGARVVMPPGVTEVVFVQDSATRRYIRLPDAAMVLAARAQLQGTATYELPLFYTQPPLNCADPSTFTVDQRLTLQAERVGDYSIGSCM